MFVRISTDMFLFVYQKVLCMWVCVNTCVSTCKCVFVSKCVSTYISVLTCSCVCVCVCQRVCMSIHVFVCVNMCVCVYQQVSYTSVTLAVCIHPNRCTSVTLVVCIHQSPRDARSHTVSIVYTSCTHLMLAASTKSMSSLYDRGRVVSVLHALHKLPKVYSQEHCNMYTRRHCLHLFLCNANNSSFHHACCGLSVFL